MGVQLCISQENKDSKIYCLRYCNKKSDNNNEINNKIKNNDNKSISPSLSTNHKDFLQKETEKNTNNNLYKNKFFKSIKFDNNEGNTNGKRNSNFSNNINHSPTKEYPKHKVILIQSFIRTYLFKNKYQKLKQPKVRFNLPLKAENEDKKIENDYENEFNYEKEETLYFNLSMNGTHITTKSLHFTNTFNSNQSTNNNNSVSFIQTIFPFNLKSKVNIKYKYLGHLLKPSNKNKSLCDISKGNDINPTFRNKTPIKETRSIKSGFGKLSFVDNTIFRCCFINNRVNGFGQYIDNNKMEEFYGEYTNNTLNGFGIYNDKMNEISGIGYFKSNGLYGIGIEKNENDGYTYYGEFEKNLKHGIGTIQWKEGTEYYGEFYRNQMTGVGIIKYPGNKTFHGNLINGKMNGFGEFFWDNNKSFFGNYKDDKREGFGIFIWKQNDNCYKESSCCYELLGISAYVGFWSNGEMEGIGIKTNLNQIKYGLWKKGKKQRWIEDYIHIRNYLKLEQLKYLGVFCGGTKNIFRLINKCLALQGEFFNLKE